MGTTPFIDRFLAVKRMYPGCVILFREGDHYEAYEDDAANICHVMGWHRLPLGGSISIEPRRRDEIVAALVRNKYRVAVCAEAA